MTPGAVGPIAFTNAVVATMDPSMPTAEVVVTELERIIAVGPKDVLKGRPDIRQIDLGGRTLLPGFIDAHHHLCLAALEPRWADLSDVPDVPTALARLREQAAREPAADWVRGFGMRDLRLRRHDLDELDVDRPVIVVHYTLHEAVVSSRGLDALGIGHHTSDPPGGKIGRDASGTPNGRLVERAWSLAQERSLASYTEPERWADLIEARMLQLHAAGITAVHDPAVPPAAEDVYRRLNRQGRMRISVLAMPHPAALLSTPDPSRLDGPPTGEGDEWLRVGAVKHFADGGPQLHGGGTIGGQHVEFGVGFPDLAESALRTTERGFGVAVHAMGNLALQATIDAVVEARRRAPRNDLVFRIEHATLAEPAQISAMADLGVAAVVQPGYVEALGPTVAPLAMEEATWMPFAALADAGVTIAGSSDSPCWAHGPLPMSRLGIAWAAPEGPLGSRQGLPMERWMEAWTSGSAAAGGQAHERGRLAPGLRADLVVLDRSHDGEPAVAETWIGGRRVFPAND